MDEAERSAPRATDDIDAGPVSGEARHPKDQRLEEALRARDRALAVVAHDLRNPISVVMTTSESLLRANLDPQVRVRVQRIATSAKRAARLVEDLLDVAAIEQGRFSVDRQRVEISKVVLAAVESQQPIAASASVVLATDLSPEPAPVDGDAPRLQEVLENLIGNAVKFTPAGGRITVGAAVQGGRVRVWVQDTGSGIPAEHLPHLFDRFYQAQRMDRRGTGLGLSICKAIVEAHAGEIGVESRVGQGTTVSFTLPVAETDGPGPGADATANLLLVDDRPENLTALQAILEQPGYRFFVASSGEEALRVALHERLSVVLLDVVMPEMDGFEVAAHLKSIERCRDLPILFVTAHGEDPQEIRRAYDAGAADYLVKPLHPEIVRKKVAVFVNLARRSPG